MHEAERATHVETLVREFFDDDVAKAVIGTKGWEAFCSEVEKAGDHDEYDMGTVVGDLAYELTADQLDWLSGNTADGSRAEAPAEFLASVVRKGIVV